MKHVSLPPINIHQFLGVNTLKFDSVVELSTELCLHYRNDGAIGKHQMAMFGVTPNKQNPLMRATANEMALARLLAGFVNQIVTPDRIYKLSEFRAVVHNDGLYVVVCDVEIDYDISVEEESRIRQKFMHGQANYTGLWADQMKIAESSVYQTPLDQTALEHLIKDRFDYRFIMANFHVWFELMNPRKFPLTNGILKSVSRRDYDRITAYHFKDGVRVVPLMMIDTEHPRQKDPKLDTYSYGSKVMSRLIGRFGQYIAPTTVVRKARQGPQMCDYHRDGFGISCPSAPNNQPAVWKGFGIITIDHKLFFVGFVANYHDGFDSTVIRVRVADIPAVNLAIINTRLDRDLAATRYIVPIGFERVNRDDVYGAELKTNPDEPISYHAIYHCLENLAIPLKDHGNKGKDFFDLVHGRGDAVSYLWPMV